MVELIAGAIAAAAVTATVSWLAIRLGPKLGFVDDPDGSTLKVHRARAVPLGGVAVLSGLAIGTIIDRSFDPALFGAATSLLILGLIDDRRNLTPRVRMAIEVAVSALYIGVSADQRGATWVLAGFILILVAINAVNLYDGLDGLAGGTGMATAAGLAVLNLSQGSPAGGPAFLAIALAVFLGFNWHPARLFLGDNGAYVVGFLLAAFALQPSAGSTAGLLARSAILGVFLVDLASTVLRRAIGRRPLFAGDRSHTYDRLHDRGWSVPAVSGLSIVTQALWAGIVVSLVSFADPTPAALVLLMAGALATAAIALSARTPSSRQSEQFEVTKPEAPRIE